MKLVLAVALFLIGCTEGGSPQSPVGPQGPPGEQGPQGPQGEPGAPGTDGDSDDGTRLKKRYLVTNDGARIYAGWFDVERQEPCSITATTPPRCLPGAMSTVVYTDDQCTSMTSYVRSDICYEMYEPQYAYVAQLPIPPCFTLSEPRIFNIGQKQPDLMVWYTKNQAGQCVQQQQDPGASYYFYSVGAEIPLTEFVAFE